MFLLRKHFHLFRPGIRAVGLRAGVANEVSLPIEAGDEHGPIVVIAAGLVVRKHWRLPPLRRHVTKALTKTTIAKLGGTAEELNRIVCAERSDRRRHRPEVFIAQRQDVRPHQGSLARLRAAVRKTYFQPCSVADLEALVFCSASHASASAPLRKIRLTRKYSSASVSNILIMPKSASFVATIAHASKRVRR